MGVAAAEDMARILRQAISERGSASVILATGNSQLAFLRALRIDASLPQVNLEMADIAFEKKNLLAARGYYQRFLKLTEKQPQSARSLWLGIRIERRLGDRDALASYELALKRLYPDSPEYKAYGASLETGN